MRKARVFFAGNIYKDEAVCSVNKLLKKGLEEIVFEYNKEKKIYYTRAKNIFIKQVEVIIKTLFCDVIVYSGLVHVNFISSFLACYFKKKTIYIMHGCLKHEINVNELDQNMGLSLRFSLKIEEVMLKKTNVICGVSEPYMNWIKEHYPVYKNKVTYLNNGIDWSIFDGYKNLITNDKKQQIVVMGGDRKTKMNLQICRAVEAVNQEMHTELEVLVFGAIFPDSDVHRSMSDISCVKHMGQQPQENVLKELGQSILYVQNSDFEPFGLAVVEALMCGCDIVISSNVGARAVFDIDDKYVIDDCSNIEKVKQAIIKGLEYPNNKKIMASISKEDTDVAATARKLLLLIDEFYKPKRK